MKLKLYGKLRKFVGTAEFDIEAKTPKEAWSFLINNFDGLDQHMKNQEYCVMAGNTRIDLDLLDLETEQMIKIIPVVHGEIWFLVPLLVGGGALYASSLIGATLLGSAILANVVSTALVVVGTNLLVDGIQQLIAPQPPPTANRLDDPAAVASYNFTGLLNTSKQGVAIPLVYGEILVGSTIVSAGVDTFQIGNKEVST